MADNDPVLDSLQQEPIPPLLRKDGEPIFRDSWEAEAFAMGNILIKQGFLTCAEWVDIFSQEIQKAQALGDPDRGDTYFSHWCSALERLCLERELTDPQTYQAQLALWRQAILNTPHGVPLALENAYRAQDSDEHERHGHHHHPALDPHHLPPNLLQPVAVVKPRLA